MSYNPQAKPPPTENYLFRISIVPRLRKPWDRKIERHRWNVRSLKQQHLLFSKVPWFGRVKTKGKKRKLFTYVEGHMPCSLDRTLGRQMDLDEEG